MHVFLSSNLEYRMTLHIGLLKESVVFGCIYEFSQGTNFTQRQTDESFKKTNLFRCLVGCGISHVVEWQHECASELVWVHLLNSIFQTFIYVRSFSVIVVII